MTKRVSQPISQLVFMPAIAFLAIMLCLTSMAQGQDDDETQSISTNSPNPGSPLPEWITTGTFTDQDGNSFHVVKSDFRFSEDDAEESLEEEIVKAISSLFDEEIESGAGKIIGYDYDRLRGLVVYANSHVVVEDATKAVLDVAGDQFPKTYTKYAQIKTDEAFVSEARGIWHQKVVQSRIQQTCVVGFAVLGVLGLVFGFMHINRVSRGMYTGRLQMIGLASILILIAIAVAVGETFHWF